MIRVLWALAFETRLDHMSMAEIMAAGEAGTLTFSEMKRVTNLAAKSKMYSL